MRLTTKCFVALVVFLVGVGLPLYASDGVDKDNYKYRVEGDWWFIHPEGQFGARSTNNYINFNQDFHFGDYSTFTGKIDWRLRRKHHIIFVASPVRFSRTATITREIEFQGQTFDAGSQVTAKMKTFDFAPGYQYDLIRRDSGYLGFQINFHLLDTDATLSGIGTVNGQTAQRTASKSLLAPLPAFGPVGRFYPLPNSNRISVEGSATGMYFFGYGNFITARASVGVGITHRLVVRGGYQMGSRLSVHGSSNEIGLRLTTTGPTAGLEYSWGKQPEEKRHEQIIPEVSNWHVDWVPIYLWFSGLHGYLGVNGYVVPVHESVSDIFSQLDIGLMTALDVRRKRWGVLSDLVFLSLTTNEKSTPIGSVYSGYTTNAKTFFWAIEDYGRVIDTDRFSADATAGARIWHLNNSVDLFQGGSGSATVTAGQTQDWVDPVIGARFRFNFDKGWYATVLGDAGGFGTGSQETYQMYGGIGKEFKKRYALLAGWRYLAVDYKSGGFLFDTHMNGLLVGFNLRCK